MATVRTFSASILSHIKAEHAETCFKPVFVNGHWRSPRFSLRRQAELRKACTLNGVDSVSIGMPPPAPQKIMQKKPPKGHKQQRQYADKQAIIKKNMEEMPEKIRKWKETLAKEKLKAKPVLPF
ncbi:hypothetical protein GGI09_003652 [Coemansia sp. S100]|nr:hypothetical protein GGI09_003652 [Coemansia sp. S100]KAJ2108574.1 hypothetical protein GGI16_001079 [Coemansia sp. S142-1]